MFAHENVRRLMAQLHLLPNDSAEADVVREQMDALYTQLTPEEQVEISLLSALLHGPSKHCPGSGGVAIVSGKGVCPDCSQQMPVSRGKLAEHGVAAEHETGFLWRVLRSLDVNRKIPIPMIMSCPRCEGRHIDKEPWATRRHHTHACQHCGHNWRPAVEPTVGVQFLPGFKDDAEKPRLRESTIVWFGSKSFNSDQLWIDGQLVGILSPDSNPDLGQACYTLHHANGQTSTTNECHSTAEYNKVREWAVAQVKEYDRCTS